ncbi:MAG: nucleotidyltransferase family protein [Thermodesulfovibrionia bacterium]|nr:nucleotidyltransferase family protein [Thermodesulfovibrionia bacterium]
MKAFLLAAGKGTRLQPLTLHTPKCLIPIAGRPLIEYWFDLFVHYGIDEVLINTSYLADTVMEYMKKHSRNLKIRITYESSLLGSGGTVKKNWDFVEEEEFFFIIYADNLTNINLKKMFESHKQIKMDVTLAVFSVPNPKECGIVEVDESLRVVSFTEKPENPLSNLAFAGIMLSNRTLKDFFPDRDIFDLGFDVLPNTIGRAAAYIVEDYLLDVGTPEKLKQAEHDVINKVFSI